MTQHATPEEKSRMIDLVKELQDIVKSLPVLVKRPMTERKKVADRTVEIKKEMQAYRRMYPNE